MSEAAELIRPAEGSSYYYLKAGDRWLYTVTVFSLKIFTGDIDWTIMPVDHQLLAKGGEAAKRTIAKFRYRQQVKLEASKTRIRG